MAKPEHGAFLPWPSIRAHTAHLHDISIQHLIDIWPHIRARRGDASFWGDEVEYQVVRLDDSAREAHLVPRQREILRELEASNAHGEFQPEYTRFQVESSPSRPYTGALRELVQVEGSLAERRKAIATAAGPQETPFTLSLFPLLGVAELAKILPTAQDDAKETIFKAAVAPVGRHQILQSNLLLRSGRKYQADVPLFIDQKTARDELAMAEDIVEKSDKQYIHLEDLVFSMGGCGLQATFQTDTLADVRTLHDQLCVLGPIMLALTAATPIYKGMLADTDARWNQACAMVDDRQPHEMPHLSSRWSCSPAYIANSPRIRKEFQHQQLAGDAAVQARLEAGGLDAPMAAYFANLHQRDPLVLFASEDASSPESLSPEAVHDSLCGSVWSHVRLKLPQPEEKAVEKAENEPPQGWLVEFRPMEVQLTDFANAAFLVFMQLLRRAVAAFDLDLYMPLAEVEENMDRAHARRAVEEGKFWFPRNPHPEMRQEGDVVLLSIDEIVDGGRETFEGLVPLIRRHLRGLQDEGGGDGEVSHPKIEAYLDFISARAAGREKTPAQWQRDFVCGHEDYSRDSRVTPRIAYDMLSAIKRMNED